jgi:hypothetical protein
VPARWANVSRKFAALLCDAKPPRLERAPDHAPGLSYYRGVASLMPLAPGGSPNRSPIRVCSPARRAIMTKPLRISVPISADDDAWLAGQADEIGCDKATVVRMMIRRAVKGVRRVLVAKVEPQAPLGPPMPVTGLEYVDVPEEPAADPSTVEAILAARVREAEEKGLVAPVPQAEAAPSAAENGVSYSLRPAPRRQAIDYR